MGLRWEQEEQNNMGEALKMSKREEGDLFILGRRILHSFLLVFYFKIYHLNAAIFFKGGVGGNPPTCERKTFLVVYPLFFQ